MVEWLDGQVQWWHWLVFGLALCGLELALPSFFVLWLGVSAAAIAVLMLLFPISFAWQLLLWAVFSIGCLVGWFKYIAPRMRDRTRSGMGREALFGQVGTVLEQNPQSNRGVLRFSAPILGEDEWRFISEDSLAPGDKVLVTDISGNDLIVKQN